MTAPHQLLAGDDCTVLSSDQHIPFRRRFGRFWFHRKLACEIKAGRVALNRIET